MKERYAKLLLGEDMSGGGKGVSSALALSNAITNLAASVFGEQHKLAPMPEDRKKRWRREGCLDNFRDQKQFWYVSKDADESEKGVQRSDKWWLPTVKVPPEGLSEESRKWMQYQKDCVNQVLKASMAINAEILAEIEIPENYIDNLPKDIGHAILESYSRVLESLANTVMNRIEDVLYADNMAQDPSLPANKRTTSSRVSLGAFIDPTTAQSPGHTPTGSPTSRTLSDFMGWSVDQEGTETTKSISPKSEDTENEKYHSKSAKIISRTKNSYMEKLEAYGLRSPTVRH
ncbi:hypothetical protein Ccrd_004037 [Cynara cardunculus var. scolymus]|uniref:PRONE domain-containing protein n=1 Tax=Cynara cardunculus var. scolymus TaxID=59895 RepID=A0A103XNH1_CYNCS|nr:hypothetical protein Ccrd_004037 [Cynara cardunculus var. scolymus]